MLTYENTYIEKRRSDERRTDDDSSFCV